MVIKKINMALAIVFLSTSLSCQYNKTNTLPNDASNNKLDTNAFIDNALIRTSVLTSCSQCHSGKTQPTLISDNDFRSHISLIQSAVNSNAMPPNKPLSDCQKDILNKWADLGTPDTSNIQVSSLPSCMSGLPIQPIEPPLTEQFITTQTVLKTSLRTCVSCHKKQKPILISDDDYKNHIEDILSEIQDKAMPPEDSSLPALTECEVAILNKWVDLNMPDQSQTKIGSLTSCSTQKLSIFR